MTSYVALLMLALAINAGDIKMLALSAVIGVGIFSPVPAPCFYLICALGELLIALLAYRLDAAASPVIVRISIILIVLHFLGFILDGYPPGSPYHILVKTFEHAELLACIFLAQPIIKKLHHGKN